VLDHVREDYVANGSSLSRPGFRAMAMHRFGTYARTVPSPLVRWVLERLHRIGSHWVRNHYGIELYATTVIGRRCTIAHQSGIVIHPFARIGDDCKIRQCVTIGQTSGSAHREGVPVIGDRVEIGAGAVIVGPVSVGDDVVIGPNAVVLRDVPGGVWVASPPAKMLAASRSECA